MGVVKAVKARAKGKARKKFESRRFDLMQLIESMAYEWMDAWLDGSESKY